MVSQIMDGFASFGRLRVRTVQSCPNRTFPGAAAWPPGGGFLDGGGEGARVDAGALGGLAVCHRVLAVRAEHLEKAKTEWVAKRLQLLRSFEREDVSWCGGGVRDQPYI